MFERIARFFRRLKRSDDAIIVASDGRKVRRVTWVLSAHYGELDICFFCDVLTPRDYRNCTVRNPHRCPLNKSIGPNLLRRIVNGDPIPGVAVIEIGMSLPGGKKKRSYRK